MPRVLYIVGGPPRVGKSALGARVMSRRAVPWLATDILKTVLRSVVGEIDELDRGRSDPDLVAERMYPYLRRAADVALDQSERFLIEGAEWFPRHVNPLRAALEEASVRACFLGHATYSHEDLVAYQGVNRWHDWADPAERQGMPEWIRRWSQRLRAECADTGHPYIDVGEMGFHEAMAAGDRALFGGSV